MRGRSSGLPLWGAPQERGPCDGPPKNRRSSSPPRPQPTNPALPPPKPDHKNAERPKEFPPSAFLLLTGERRPQSCLLRRALLAVVAASTFPRRPPPLFALARTSQTLPHARRPIGWRARLDLLPEFSASPQCRVSTSLRRASSPGPALTVHRVAAIQRQPPSRACLAPWPRVQGLTPAHLPSLLASSPPATSFNAPRFDSARRTLPIRSFDPLFQTRAFRLRSLRLPRSPSPRLPTCPVPATCSAISGWLPFLEVSRLSSDITAAQRPAPGLPFPAVLPPRRFSRPRGFLPRSCLRPSFMPQPPLSFSSRPGCRCGFPHVRQHANDCFPSRDFSPRASASLAGVRSVLPRRSRLSVQPPLLGLDEVASFRSPLLPPHLSLPVRLPARNLRPGPSSSRCSSASESALVQKPRHMDATASPPALQSFREPEIQRVLFQEPPPLVRLPPPPLLPPPLRPFRSFDSALQSRPWSPLDRCSQRRPATANWGIRPAPSTAFLKKVAGF